MEKISSILSKLRNSRGYFVKTLRIAVFGIRNNLVLAGILLFSYCVIAPVFSIFLMDSWSGEGGHIVNQGLGTFCMLAVCLTGMLVPGTLFNFVHHRRDSDFYNAMPVKRSQYFIGYGISGFLLFFVPYLLMCIIHAAIGSTFGAAASAFLWFWQFVGVYVIVYSAMVFSMMFSGSLLSSLATFGLLNSFVFVLLYCSIHMSWSALDTYAYEQLLAPYYLIFMPVGSSAVAAIDDYSWIMPIQLVLAVIELVLAYLMYKHRRGETTMAVAFPKTRYILQYGVMFVITLFTFQLFNYNYGWRDNTSTAVIMSAIVTIVTFIVMNMVLEQNFRAAFHRIRHLFIFSAGFIAVVCVISAIVSALPAHIIPIRADALRVTVTYYDLVDYEPKNDDSDPEYEDYSYVRFEDYQGETRYFGQSDYDRFIVTDKAQVDSIMSWINGRINDVGYGYFQDTEDASWLDGFYMVDIQVLSLKWGTELKEGMTTDQARGVISQNFSVYFTNVDKEDVDYLFDCRAYTEKSGTYALYGGFWQIKYDQNVDGYKYGNGAYDYDDWREYAESYYGGYHYSEYDEGTVAEATTFAETEVID